MRSMPKTNAAPILGWILLATISCSTDEPDGLRLADLLSQKATELQASQQSTIVVEYQMTIDAPSIVALISSEGLQTDTLPDGITTEQLSKLSQGAEFFPARSSLAIVWQNGYSGSSLRLVDVHSQQIIFIPRAGAVKITLGKQPNGTIAVTSAQ